MLVIPENRPALDSEPFCGTIVQLLDANIGKTIRADFFLEGRVVTHEGVLDAVGAQYLVLHRPANNTFVVCDLAPLRFVTVLP